MFVWNLMLMLIYAALLGDFSSHNLIIGFILGYVALGLLSYRGLAGSQNYTARFPKILRLTGFFLLEMIRANIRLAIDVIRPGFHFRPGIVAVHTDARTDAEITTLSTMISLTPGTLTIDVSDDRKVLYIHAMYLDPNDPQAVEREIKQGLEKRLLEAIR
jgi:multicomponent Na+:H+ antiporter subunit E